MGKQRTTTKRRIKNKMDTKKYIKESSYLSVKTVKNEWQPEDRVITIMGAGEEKTYKNEKTGENQLKLQIPVMRATNKQHYEWTLSQTAIKDLAADLGTYDSNKWVGASVKLMIRPAGAGETLTCTVLTRP